MTGTSSKQKAINAKCEDCIYDSSVKLSATKQITLCTMKDCALYEFRPISNSTAESFVKLKMDLKEPLPGE